MNVLLMKRLPILVLTGLLLCACAITEDIKTTSTEPDVLTIYPDGTMRLKDRTISRKDVVIYPDGYGGEKAAIKVWGVPFHPPFYRDSIVVERLEEFQVVDN